MVMPQDMAHTGPTRRKLRPEVAVVNIFALADFGGNIEISDEEANRRALDFRRASAQVSYLRFPESPVLLRIFKSGKVRATGGRSLSEVKTTLAALIPILRRSGRSVKLPHLEVLNMVSVVALGYKLNLVHLASEAPDFVAYDPEFFPACVVRLTSGATGLVFGTGKVIITGAKSMGSIRTAVDEVTELVRSSRALAP